MRKKDLVVIIDLVNLQKETGLSYKVLFFHSFFSVFRVWSIDDERKEGNIAKCFPCLFCKNKEFFWL
jgi:hypothetical protein